MLALMLVQTVLPPLPLPPLLLLLLVLAGAPPVP